MALRALRVMGLLDTYSGRNLALRQRHLEPSQPHYRLEFYDLHDDNDYSRM
jgi:hypothetical protein